MTAKDTDTITYVPGGDDPPSTEWNGIVFRAGKPVSVTRQNTVRVPITECRMAPDGTVTTRAIEQSVPMVDLAKGNPKFSVNGEKPYGSAA
jgi:hypothetical protein